MHAASRRRTGSKPCCAFQVLGPTRRAIPRVGGVDVAPIIWVAALSFINEILLGPQGILILLQRKVDF